MSFLPSQERFSSAASSFHLAEWLAIDKCWLLLLMKMRSNCLPSFIPTLPILLQWLPLNVCLRVAMSLPGINNLKEHIFPLSALDTALCSLLPPSRVSFQTSNLPRLPFVGVSSIPFPQSLLARMTNFTVAALEAGLRRQGVSTTFCR